MLYLLTLITSFYFAIDTQTPNYVPDVTNVPSCHDQANMPQNARYPTHECHMLQWPLNPGPTMFIMVLNNINATFKTNSRKLKPLDLLLHYNYGATAIKWWGHGMELLKNCENYPHPSMPRVGHEPVVCEPKS